MRTFWQRCRRKKNKAALRRLERIRAFTYIIERLAAHKGGKAFAVNTEHLKEKPPAIWVTERRSTNSLQLAHCVATLVMHTDRKLLITTTNETQLTYIIS